MTDRLDRIEEGLETLSNTINLLIIEFIQPSAQQARANYERLDRLEAALERTVDGQSVNEQQIARNAEAFSVLTERAIESDDRFNILIQEMRADRRASQQATQALLLAMANINGRVEDLEQAS
ncbi:hypothetical protein [cf. Phormidesmis sp. LEGE 11477]|uniref:hypothetical protein n=1 Tax=cf. Phormidesmis sp. LEGE 11477 TaxID=1828680 RepID=UPI00187E715A|nr:hypothetical protein [cf. Phormidesmis sp. LEGE 11477]MBE9060981.1 hypothetical protein [cf. Phormidesmis sp. LEGE 11477]